MNGENTYQDVWLPDIMIWNIPHLFELKTLF